eukprot:TRINITY_DN24665_c1_g1_i2.p7 TRINITY_DN24665_c1_g1~~TRINITY_DN24665_c1_g1_i2.p7  ORF type:complete len:107 (-),score=4.77 TRINITY_DN24665_c1_g1_i2:1001-1321(-)
MAYRLYQSPASMKVPMTEASATYPVLPLRDIVVFPHMIVPLFVGREKSVRALEEVMQDDKQILLVTQKNASQDDPSPDDIYNVFFFVQSILCFQEEHFCALNNECL